MPSICKLIVDLKAQLNESLLIAGKHHQEGKGGLAVCREISDARDNAINAIFHDAIDSSDPNSLPLALVLHGGSGRRDNSPFSDVDLMFLYSSRQAAEARPIIDHLVRAIFDVGLNLGHTARTSKEAIQSVFEEPADCTSLLESRLLVGNRALFDDFYNRLERSIAGKTQSLIGGIEKARREEMEKHGETVFLLEPNLKKSRGGLRDWQMIRWLGKIRWDTFDLDELVKERALASNDLPILDKAYSFLLELRNELHFQSGWGNDLLHMSEQIRIAQKRKYQSDEKKRDVERLVQTYFLHSGVLDQIASSLTSVARQTSMKRLATTMFGRRLEGGVWAGPQGLRLSLDGIKSLRGGLTEILRVISFSNLYDTPVAPDIWVSLRRAAALLNDEPPSPEAISRFISLLKHPARLGPCLREMHELGILKRFIPGFDHARGLMQFNQYHKYTVDEHCLRAVDRVASYSRETRMPVKEYFERLPTVVYRKIDRKWILHLATLIHDLGKGLGEDHILEGTKLAEETATQLTLSEADTRALLILVKNHQLMNQIALSRDINDAESLAILTSTVESQEILRMLYILSTADLFAVGPETWDLWKATVLGNFYQKAMQKLTGEQDSV
jgi:[protein-PII] uridylyltransferase